MFDFFNRTIYGRMSAGMAEDPDRQIAILREQLEQADAVVIGAGAGLSTSAGFTYSGERFEKYFRDFEEKYGCHDMYSMGFYPYESMEEFWGFWCRNIWVNRYMPIPSQVYQDLLELVEDRDYFVLTTNVDHCFQKSGFDKKRLFYTQGDYGLFQSSSPGGAAENRTYDNYEIVRKMILSEGYKIADNGELIIPENTTIRMTVPSELVPVCPDDGKLMTTNLRCDDTFVQDDGWYAAQNRYHDFLIRHQGMKTLFLETGVGGNTPVIIWYPFRQYTDVNKNIFYTCIKGEAYCLQEICVLTGISLLKISRRKSHRSDFLHGENKQMTQNERRIYLIQELQKEMPEYAGYQIPEDEKEQQYMLKGLFNVRPVQPASEEFTRIQDEYLQERAREKGITDCTGLPSAPADDRLILWQGDITTLKCDAVVNAGNNSLTGCWNPNHLCVDNLIQTFSGYQTRQAGAEYMEKQREIHGQDYVQPTAVPMITSAYNLPSRYIIHVVGPIVSPFLMQEHKDQLAQCYCASLDLAAENGCENIAFCCISTGVFMFPQDKAAEIAVAAVKEWMDGHPDSCMKKVIFNVFKDSDLSIYQRLLGAIDSHGFKKIMR